MVKSTIAYSVLMTNKVSNYQYDLAVNDQGQIYSKSLIRLSFLTGGFHIWYNDCLNIDFYSPI